MIEKFIQDLPGCTQKTAPRMEKQVSRLITSAAKIHAGQLIEFAKQIQIEEIKNSLALKYPLLKAESN